MATFFLHCSENIINYEICLSQGKAGFKTTGPKQNDLVYLLIRRNKLTYCGARGTLLRETKNKPWPDAENYKIAFDIKWEICVEFVINEAIKKIYSGWGVLVQSPKNLENFDNTGSKITDWLKLTFESNFSNNISPINVFTEDNKKSQYMKLIPAFIQYLKTQNLIYEDRLVKRFVCSLATKPFVILTGNSGSGKSRIAVEFSKFITNNNNLQYTLVPVGADWTDNRSVLGYFNPLSEPATYVSTPILELLLSAEKDSASPYFLILDEMNLSHVERYFSDFLSLMESSKQAIKLHSSSKELKATGNEALNIPKQIEELPRNLFVIGTVNIDETTYMFSPKVLDRANVIEIKTTKKGLEEYKIKTTKEVGVVATKSQIAELMNASEYSLKPENADWKHPIKDSENIKNEILRHFECLERYYLEFGFRTLNEGMCYNQVVKEMVENTALSFDKMESIDEQVVQKFITKLNGSKSKMDSLLKELFKLASGQQWSKDWENDASNLAASKLNQMIIRINQDQFVSFI